MYGKLIDGKLQLAPNPIVVDKMTIANPSENILIEQEYLPILNSESPKEEGYYFTPYYEVEDNVIVQKWQAHKKEVAITTEQRLEAVESAVEDLILLTMGGE